MCVTLYGRLLHKEGGKRAALARIEGKYAAKWGVQMAGMNFQSHFRSQEG